MRVAAPPPGCFWEAFSPSVRATPAPWALLAPGRCSGDHETCPPVTLASALRPHAQPPSLSDSLAFLLVLRLDPFNL